MKIIFSSLALLLMAFSCKKEDVKPESTNTKALEEKKELLCSKSWRYASKVLTIDSVGVIDNLMDCEKDDIFMFFNNGQKISNRGTTFCINQPNTITDTSRWEFGPLGTTLLEFTSNSDIEGTYIYQLETLTTDRLVVSVEYVSDGLKNKIKAEFTH
jgi:hypothetical protein